MTELCFSEARPLTRQPDNHFFGYYGILPWNASERLYACLESDFHERPHVRGDWRCDLHPRWNRSGTQVSFDSVHTGDRQVYVVDLSDLNASLTAG